MSIGLEKGGAKNIGVLIFGRKRPGFDQDWNAIIGPQQRFDVIMQQRLLVQSPDPMRRPRRWPSPGPWPPVSTISMSPLSTDGPRSCSGWTPT